MEKSERDKNKKEVIPQWISTKGKKGKVHPIRGHEGPEAEKRYSSTLSLT